MTSRTPGRDISASIEGAHGRASPRMLELLEPLAELRALPGNAKGHPLRQLRLIRASLEAWGAQVPIVRTPDGVVLHGNGTVAAALLGPEHDDRDDGRRALDAARLELPGASGEELTARARELLAAGSPPPRWAPWTHLPVSEWDGPPDDAARAFALAMNRLPELGDWIGDALLEDLERLASSGPDLIAAAGFRLEELDGLRPRPAAAALTAALRTPPPAIPAAPPPPPPPPVSPPPPVEEPREEEDAKLPLPPPLSLPGTVYRLGRHRLYVGSSTRAEDVRALLEGVAIDLICTDPPYCSGGWQEAGKARSSTKGMAGRSIANDRLSTRGFQALIRAVLEVLDARAIAMFTDWRMWTPLADVVEAGGFPVRGMVVWDKLAPGPGRGHRAQHELVMVGHREDVFSELPRGRGNVIPCARSGNKWHTTEKPVELLARLLAPYDGSVRNVADPFAGSGSTVLACETEGEGRTCYAMELDPTNADTARHRWALHVAEHGGDLGDGLPVETIARRWREAALSERLDIGRLDGLGLIELRRAWGRAASSG